MAKRLAAALCAGLLATHGVSYAQNATTTHADKRGAPVNADERWSIRAFLERRKERATIRRLSVEQPGQRTTRWQDAGALHYRDHSSPLSRMRALNKWRLATLWRGQRSTLVLGLVGNGYFGVRLDAAERDADNETATAD